MIGNKKIVLFTLYLVEMAKHFLLKIMVITTHNATV